MGSNDYERPKPNRSAKRRFSEENVDTGGLLRTALDRDLAESGGIRMQSTSV
jgi:hypothetical protein